MNPLKIINPCLLFDGANLKSSYREMILKYHPDKNKDKDAQAITTHITNCYDILSKLDVPTDGLKQIKPLEIGTAYFYDDKIIFKAPGLEDLFDRYKINFRFPNDEMKKEFKGADVKAVVEKDRVTIQIMPGCYPLSNVFTPGKPMDPKHVAWIISRLLNVTCFLHYNEISHNGILVENCFIDAADHKVFIYGGAWYNNKMGTPLKALCLTVYNQLPPDVQMKRISVPEIDLISVKEIGKQLLGGGMDLLFSTVAPKQMLEWIHAPVQNSAFKEFEIWDEVLEQSFGKRQFVEFATDPFAIWNR